MDFSKGAVQVDMYPTTFLNVPAELTTISNGNDLTSNGISFITVGSSDTVIFGKNSTAADLKDQTTNISSVHVSNFDSNLTSSALSSKHTTDFNQTETSSRAHQESHASIAQTGYDVRSRSVLVQPVAVATTDKHLRTMLWNSYEYSRQIVDEYKSFMECRLHRSLTLSQASAQRVLSCLDDIFTDGVSAGSDTEALAGKIAEVSHALRQLSRTLPLSLQTAQGHGTSGCFSQTDIQQVIDNALALTKFVGSISSYMQNVLQVTDGSRQMSLCTVQDLSPSGNIMSAFYLIQRFLQQALSST